MYLSPSPVQQFFDTNGVPLVGGKLFTYAAGSVTKQAAFTDSSGGTPLPDPVILNSRGEVAPTPTATSCGLWLDPTLAYKLVLAPSTDTDPPTNPIWTIDNIVSATSAVLAALAQYEASLTGVPIGGMLAFGGATIPPGWLLCYGQAVSRTTYAALYAVLGNAYGAGDGTTTFNLPDKRGRASIGADNMGGAPAGNVTEAVSGVDATVVGADGGSQYAQADNLTAVTEVAVAVTDPGHFHGIARNLVAPGSFLSGLTGYPAGNDYPPSETAYTGIGVAATATTTVETGSVGSSQNMMPVEVDNWILYTGVLA